MEKKPLNSRTNTNKSDIKRQVTGNKSKGTFSANNKNKRPSNIIVNEIEIN